jgi:hypothetical protein
MPAPLSILQSASRQNFRQSHQSAQWIDHHIQDVVEPFDTMRKPAVPHYVRP